MTDFGTAKSLVEPEEIVIDEYSVWVADNIHEDDREWVYTLTQYEKDEYIKLMVDKNAALEEQLTDTQIALCDVYEMIGG